MLRFAFSVLSGCYLGRDCNGQPCPMSCCPSKKKQALQLAFAQSPTINAAIENLNAAQAEARSKNSPLLPRFDLRLRQELEHDRDGIDGRFDEQAVEVVMTYNLYKGGTHSAEKRQFHERVNAAKEQAYNCLSGCAADCGDCL